MALNLLGYMSNNPNAVAQAGGGAYKPNNAAGVGGMSIAPQSMGQTAVTPTANVKPPASTLPQSKANPVTTPATPPAPTTYDYNTGKPLAPGQAQSQYNMNTGQQIGTQTQPQSNSYSGAGATAQNNTPTYNPYTGSTASTPTYGTSGTGGTANPNAQFQSSNPQNLPTFTGLLSQAVNQQNSPYNTMATNNINQTAQYGAGNIGIGQNAQNIADQYGKQIAQVGQQGAAFRSGQLTRGTAPVAEGNATVTTQNTAAQQNALATGEQAALQGIGYQLTGQNQAANASNAAAGQSLTGQGQTYGALQNAYTAAKPTVENYGQTSYNPTTNSFGTSGSNQVQPNDPLYPALQSYATMAANGQYSAIPTSITGNPALSAQLNSMAQQLNPNYSPITSAAQGAGQAAVTEAPYTGQATGAAANAAASGQTSAQNTITAGTAAANSYNSIYSAANTQAATTATQQAQIRSVGQQALGLMQSDPAINKFVTQFGNQAVNKLQTQLSNPQYAAFNTAIQSLRARIGAALQAGEIPTAATGNAASIANGDISLDALGSTLSQVDTELSSFVQTQNALAAYAKGQMGSGGGSAGNSGGGSYTSSSGATYNLPY